MIETFKEFSFEAAHKVPPYSDIHGHSFRVSVHIRGEVDEIYGWAANMYEVDGKIEGVREMLDHRYLNDVEGLEIPSLENLCTWVWNKLSNTIAGLDSISVVRGMPGSQEGCTYRPRMS